MSSKTTYICDRCKKEFLREHKIWQVREELARALAEFAEDIYADPEDMADAIMATWLEAYDVKPA